MKQPLEATAPVVLVKQQGAAQPRRPPRALYTALAVLLLILATVALFVWWRGGIPVRVVPVRRGTVVSAITSTATGTVESERSVRMMSQIPGQIAAILVDEGYTVRQGDLMARLDDDEANAAHRLADAALRNALANQERAEVSLRVRGETADTEITRAAAVLEKAAADRARAEELFAAGIIPRSSLEGSEIEERLARSGHRAAMARGADREVARSEVAAAVALVAQTQAALQVASVALARTRITAPFDGIVSSRQVQQGQTITPTTPLFEIVDNDDLHVRATFDEVDIGVIKVGQEVRISMDSFPGRSFGGKVREISPTVSTSKQENRTVTVKILLPGGTDDVRPGMSADAEILIGSRTDALYLPTDVIAAGGSAAEGRRVLAVSGERAIERLVTTGLSNWDFTEILSGVSENEPVITTLDAEGLAPGVRVRVIKGAAPSGSR